MQTDFSSPTKRAAGHMAVRPNSLRCSTVRLTCDEHHSAACWQQLCLPPAPLGCGDQDGAASQQEKSTSWWGKQRPHGGLQQSHTHPHAGWDARGQWPQQAQDERQGQEAGSGLHPLRPTVRCVALSCTDSQSSLCVHCRREAPPTLTQVCCALADRCVCTNWFCRGSRRRAWKSFHWRLIASRYRFKISQTNLSKFI